MYDRKKNIWYLYSVNLVGAGHKTITAPLYFADSSENLRQAKCQIYNIGMYYGRFLH